MSHQKVKVEKLESSMNEPERQAIKEQPIEEEQLQKKPEDHQNSEDIKIKLQDINHSQIKYEKIQTKQENLGLTRQESTPLIPDSSQKANLSKNINVSKKGKRKILQIQKLEDVRLIAADFLENGLNFRKFNKLHPQIDGKFYRNTVQAVNNTAVNEIQKFLRYECNIQIQRLNRDQKRSIRTQLTQVRFWLAKKDMAQLQTFYKFIQRRYELVDVQISLEEALKLYKTILQIVKSPYVDVLQDDIKPQILDPEAASKAELYDRQMKQKTLILLFLRYKNLTKVADCLCQKFGYSLSWSKHGVKQKIKYLLKNSLKKLIGSVEAYEKSIQLFFSQSDECVKLLLTSETSLNIRLLLLSFYLQKTITLIQLREFVRSVNKFFIQEYKTHGQYECKKFQQDVKLPKLQKKVQEQIQNNEEPKQKEQKQKLKLPEQQIKIDKKLKIQSIENLQLKIQDQNPKFQKKEKKEEKIQSKKSQQQSLVIIFDQILQETKKE